MRGRKYCNIILSSFTLVACLFLSSTHRSQPGQQFLGNRIPTQRVDGGGPVPPLPPKPFLKTLTADGGGPVPPLPPKPLLKTLTADGGGPVPPIPPKPFLTVDGGGPVPPLPPPPPTADFLAV